MLGSFKIALVAVSLLVGGTALADRGGPRNSGATAGKRADVTARRANAASKRMAKFDANKDGKLDRAERTAMAKAKFDRLDKNHDGVLSFEEAQRMLKRGRFHERGFRGDRQRGDGGNVHRPDRDE